MLANFNGIEVRYKPKPPFFSDTDLRVPENGTFGFVLHDWQLADSGEKPRQLQGGYEQKDKPMPATRMLWGRYEGRIYDFVPFSKDWQFWLVELLRKAIPADVPYGKVEKVLADNYLEVTPGSLLWAYVNLVQNHRSFTDGHAPESGYRDWVTSRNMSAKDYQWKCLTTTGNIVKILGESGKYYIIEALDLLKPPPSVEYKPWLIHWATEQTVVELPQLDGHLRWVVSRYPQIKIVCRKNGLAENGTPFPLCSMGGTNLICKSDVKIVVGNYSPYVPEK